MFSQFEMGANELYQRGRKFGVQFFRRAGHAQRSSERIVFAFVDLARNDVDADGVILQTRQDYDNGPLPEQRTQFFEHGYTFFVSENQLLEWGYRSGSYQL